MGGYESVAEGVIQTAKSPLLVVRLGLFGA